MAKPKRFHESKDFEIQITHVIEELIFKNNLLPELERKDLQVRDIAVEFEVTSNTLRRWCKEHIGISARDFLAEYRINRAKFFLKQGVKPALVSKVLAFNEHKVFSTIFKRVVGIPPSKLVIQESNLSMQRHSL